VTIEQEESIRKAAITAVTGIIDELQRCGHAAPDLSLDNYELRAGKFNLRILLRVLPKISYSLRGSHDDGLSLFLGNFTSKTHPKESVNLAIFVFGHESTNSLKARRRPMVGCLAIDVE
jgi:hypothetical protein